MRVRPNAPAPQCACASSASLHPPAHRFLASRGPPLPCIPWRLVVGGQAELEEEQREAAKLEREREELREQFESEQAERRRKEKAKLEKERGGDGGVVVSAPRAGGGPRGGAVGAVQATTPPVNTCLTYEERMAARAEEYHQRQEERELQEQRDAQLGACGGAGGAVESMADAGSDGVQHGRRRSHSRPVSVGPQAGVEESVDGMGVDAHRAHPPPPPVAAQMPAQMSNETRAELRAMRDAHAQLQLQQAEQMRAAQEQQAAMAAAAAAEMEQLRRQNEELRGAMAEQYERLQREQQALQSQLAGQPHAAQQEELRNAMAQQYEHLQREQAAMQRRLDGREMAAAPPAQPPSRCDSALSESVLRTPYLDPTHQPPARVQLPVPPPEVEEALARLRQPGVATAAVAGEITADERGWSPLIQPSAEEEKRRAIGALAPPAQHPALRGPVPSLHADGGGGTLGTLGTGSLRSSLRGASELIYPSDDTLRRSLQAQEVERDAAIAHASNRLSSAAKLGFPPPLPMVPESSDEPFSRSARELSTSLAGSRPRSEEGSRRPPSAGPRPGSSPAQVPPLHLGSPEPAQPSTPGLDTLVRRAEERLRQLQLTENASPEAMPSFQGRGPLGARGDGGRQDGGHGMARADLAQRAGSGTGVLRESLRAESAYVPLPPHEPGGTPPLPPRALADGELPEWLHPPHPRTHGGRGTAGDGRDALASRGSSVSVAESTTAAIARRTEQQLRRLHAYEDDLADLTDAEAAEGELPGNYPAAGAGAARRAERAVTQPPLPVPVRAAAPAASGRAEAPSAHSMRPSTGTTQDVEERLQWLRQLEAQLGMEGVVIPPSPSETMGGGNPNGAAARVAKPLSNPPPAGSSPLDAQPPTSAVSDHSPLHTHEYDVEARLERLQRLEAGMKEKEELDSLLQEYLQKS